MNYSTLLYIARTHILTRGKQSAIAGLGVTFGIATFIVLVSFMTGLNGLLDGLMLDRTPHIHLYNEIIPSEKQPIEMTESSDSWSIVRSIKPKQKLSRIHNVLPILKALEDDPKVLGATAQLATQAFYTAGSISLNGMVTGVDILAESRLYNIDAYIVSGDIHDLHNNDNAIIIGAGIAKKLLLDIGDKIQIVNPEGNRTLLKVVGVYQSGLAEIDNMQSYVNVKTAQRIMGEGNNYITDINIKLHDIENALPMSKDYQRLYDVSAMDIGTANAQFETGTSIRNIITYAVSITLLIVAGFGIYNILNMFIYEKMNDIAILKATGFSGNDVMFIFISQALIIGLVGGFMGLAVGYLLSVLIDNLPFVTEALPTIKTYPVNFDPSYYIIGAVFALVSTFLAGYLPAKKAKQIDPVEILRGQ